MFERFFDFLSFKLVNIDYHRTKLLFKNEKALLFDKNVPLEDFQEIKKRLAFYCPKMKLEPADRNALFGLYPILIFSNEGIPNCCRYIRGGMYSINFRQNPNDGFEWIKLASLCFDKPVNASDSKDRFISYFTELEKKHLDKCYIFGTGPSLEKASEYDWSDGYRVVCNTIVKDKKLWSHIQPDFFVAGDTIYHFGHTQFAKAFRKDLLKRLGETHTYFLYPSIFHPIVQREFQEYSDRCLPVPMGIHKKIHTSLVENYSLPNFENVLNLMLLPLACTLSKNVYLWGFDGRKPDDKNFWSYSSNQFYPEYFLELQEAHPRFFSHHIPKNDQFNYIKRNLGDELDKNLTIAENEGFHFIMMHPSYTATLQKRYNG